MLWIGFSISTSLPPSIGETGLAEGDAAAREVERPEGVDHPIDVLGHHADQHDRRVVLDPLAAVAQERLPGVRAGDAEVDHLEAGEHPLQLLLPGEAGRHAAAVGEGVAEGADADASPAAGSRRVLAGGPQPLAVRLVLRLVAVGADRPPEIGIEHHVGGGVGDLGGEDPLVLVVEVLDHLRLVLQVLVALEGPQPRRGRRARPPPRGRRAGRERRRSSCRSRIQP